MVLLDRLITWVGRALAFVSVMLMLMMVIHVTGSITMRWLTGRDLPLTMEMTTYYYMVGMTFLPLAFIDMKNAHIRADFFGHFVQTRLFSAWEIVIQACMALFFAFLTWRTFLNARERTVLGEVIATTSGQIDIWPARWMVPIGCAVACAYSILLTIRCIRAHFSGRDATELTAPTGF